MIQIIITMKNNISDTNFIMLVVVLIIHIIISNGTLEIPSGQTIYQQVPENKKLVV